MEAFLSTLTLSKIYLFLGVFLFVCLLVITAIMLDLWDGVHTARKTNQRVHSHKLRVTIEKMSEYFRFMVIGFIVDCIGMFFGFYILPFVGMAFGAGLIGVEMKSMFEHAGERKSHIQRLPDLLDSIVKCATHKDAEALLKNLKEIQTK